MRTRISELPTWISIVYVCVPVIWVLIGQHPDVDHKTLYYAVTLAIAVFSWVPMGWVVSPEGVERTFGPWRLWRIPWEDFDAWWWLPRYTIIGQKRLLVPRGIVITTKQGRWHQLRVYGQKFEGGYVIPGEKAARVLETLWQYGGHNAQGWLQTVGYYERVAAAGLPIPETVQP